MRTHDVRVPVLMVTGNESAKAAADAISAKIFAYIPKPFDLVKLDHIVALALPSSSEHDQAARANASKRISKE